MDAGVFASGVVSVALVGVYLYIAAKLARRKVPATGRLAVAQFSIWWGGIGIVGGITGVEAIIGAFGALTFPFAMTMYLLTILLDCVFLWGLVGYLTYLYTGRYHLLPLSAFYAIFYIVVVYAIFTENPTGFSLASGTPTITGSGSLNPILEGIVVFALIVPEFGAAILYLTLLRATTDRTLRYRILLVGLSIFLWFGLDISLGAPSELLSLVRGVLAALVALLSLVAYLPPRWVQTRLHVTPVELDTAAHWWEPGEA